MLLQIVYLSNATREFRDAQVAALARRSAEKNRSHDITGVLYYDSGHFIQCIEGDDQDLIRLYSRIIDDPRHSDVVTAVIKPIQERSFPDWNMGVVADLPTEIDFDAVLPLDDARSGAWNEATWTEILDSFRLATDLNPFPQD